MIPKNPIRGPAVARGPGALAIFVLLLTAIEGQAQQVAPPSSVEPCLGYAYNIRPTPMLPSGIQTVAQVLPATPAENGGLRAGDLLVSIEGVPVTAGAATLAPGDTIPFVVSREGGNVVLQMVVGQRQSDDAGEAVCRPWTGNAAGPTVRGR